MQDTVSIGVTLGSFVIIQSTLFIKKACNLFKCVLGAYPQAGAAYVMIGRISVL
jgi:hypothetical protein